MPWISGKLPRKTPPSTFHLRADEWVAFASLLQSGYSLTQALHFLKKDNQQLLEAFHQGKAMEDILQDEKQDIFHQHILFFLQFLSLPNAIMCAQRLVSFTQGNKRNLQKQTAYPCFLLIFAYATLYIFCSYVIPQMQTGFSQYLKGDSMMVIVGIVQHSIQLISILLIIGVGLIILLKCNCRIRYQWLCKVSAIKMISSYFSYMLAGYLQEMSQAGLSTKICFQYLSSHTHSYVIQETSKAIHQCLQMGHELQDALHQPLIDEGFQQLVSIGAASGRLADTLQDYMDIQQMQWTIWMKRIAMVISGVAYGFVGLVALCVYRMMLVPLELLNTM